MYLRMSFQIVPQRRMIFEIFLVIRQRRVLGKLAGDIIVAFQKLAEVREFATAEVAIPVHSRVLALIKALLLMHECVGIFLVLFAHSRMLRQELLQRRMTLFELLVIPQRRILSA